MQTRSGSGQEVSVLLVDDEADVRMAIGLLLSDGLGMAVTQTGDSAEALELYRARAFDFVVTDYNMPKLRGDALAAAIKAINPAQPIIMVSGFLERILINGKPPPTIDAVVRKPCPLAELAEALKHAGRPE